MASSRGRQAPAPSAPTPLSPSSSLQGLTESLARMHRLQSEGALSAMDDEAKRAYFERLRRKKAEIEAMLRALELSKQSSSASSAKKDDDSDDEELYQNTADWQREEYNKQHQQDTRGQGEKLVRHLPLPPLLYSLI